MSKRVRLGLFLLILLEGLYVIAAGIFLNAGILKSLINTKPDEIKLDYKWALSPWPGYAYVRDVSFRIQDSNLQIYFAMSSVRVGVNLLALKNREFHATSVNGKDLMFRLRFRRELRPDFVSDVKHLPEIPGLVGVGKPPPDNGPPPVNPWRVRLGQVHIRNLYELWLDSVRFAGKATVDGGMYLKPGHEAEIQRSHVAVESGELAVESTTVLQKMEGRITSEILRSPAGALAGVGLLNRSSGQIQFRSELRSLELLNHYLRVTKMSFYGDGKGTLNLNLAYADGHFLKSSFLEAHSGKLRARFWEHALEGEGRVKWKVERAGKDPLSHLLIELKNYHMGKSTSRRYPIEGETFVLAAKSRNLTFRDPLADVAISLKIPRADITDVRYVNTFLPKQSGIQFVGGRGTLAADLNIDPKRSTANFGWVKVGGRAVDVAIEQARVRADVEARWKIKTSNWDSAPLNLSGSVVRLRALKSPDEPDGWWANIIVDEGQVKLADGSRVQAKLTVEARDARPVMDVYLRAGNESLPGIVKDVLEFKSLRLAFGVEIDEKRFALTNIRAVGDKTELLGWMKNRDEDRRGRFLLKWGPFAAGLRVEGENVGVRLQDAIGWYKKQSP